MKLRLKNNIAVVITLGLFLLPALLHAAEAGKAPAVVTPESAYTFEAVAEGDPVLHDFIIRNKGNAVLNILDIKTTCGCTTASIPGPIPPGAEGTISVRFNTTGYGGNTVQKTIKVKTDDPTAPELSLTITGPVDKIYTLSPDNVRLQGVLGQEITQTVTLIPEKGHPFSVKGVTAKRGKSIRFRFTEVKDPEGARYEIVVENTRQEPGPYFDTLFVQTDSTTKPEIKIPVYGSIRKPTDGTPGSKAPALLEQCDSSNLLGNGGTPPLNQHPERKDHASPETSRSSRNFTSLPDGGLRRRSRP